MGSAHPSRPNAPCALGSGQAKAIEGEPPRLPERSGMGRFGLRREGALTRHETGRLLTRAARFPRRSQQSRDREGAMGRFMESPLFLTDLLTGHEPCSEVLLAINGLRTRFMGSPFVLADMLTRHEPGRAGPLGRPCFRRRARRSRPTEVRFMRSSPQQCNQGSTESRPHDGRFKGTLGGRWLMILLSLALVAGILARPLRGAPSPAGEYPLKAVFLFNFVQFVEWPASAFADSKAPIILGIVGRDPFGAVLDNTIKGEKVNGRPLEIRRLKADEDLAACHVVFFSRSGKEDAAGLVQKLEGRPVLTVGEIEGFAELGGVINFVMVDRKVRFEVNPQAAAQQGVKISSRLLQLGRVVEPAPKKP